MCCDFLTVSPLMRSAAVGVWRRTVFLAKLRFYPLNLLYVDYQIRVAYQISVTCQIIIALGTYITGHALEIWICRCSLF